MKIVILDTYPYQAQAFDFLQAYGQVVCYEHTTPMELHERIRDAEVVLTNKTKLTEADFAIATKLRYSE